MARVLGAPWTLVGRCILALTPFIDLHCSGDGDGFTISFPHPFCPQIDLFVAAHHYASGADALALQPAPPSQLPISLEPDERGAGAVFLFGAQQGQTHLEGSTDASASASATTEGMQWGNLAAGSGAVDASAAWCVMNAPAAAAHASIGAAGTAEPLLQLAAVTRSGMFASGVQSDLLLKSTMALDDILLDDSFFI